MVTDAAKAAGLSDEEAEELHDIVNRETRQERRKWTYREILEETLAVKRGESWR